MQSRHPTLTNCKEHPAVVPPLVPNVDSFGGGIDRRRSVTIPKCNVEVCVRFHGRDIPLPPHVFDLPQRACVKNCCLPLKTDRFACVSDILPFTAPVSLLRDGYTLQLHPSTLSLCNHLVARLISLLLHTLRAQNLWTHYPQAVCSMCVQQCT
eukprot:m.82029 g.82029  ORF g.82029 m.82029 type:complete len:153 (+) comp11054_c0_seq2:103-561(+)